MIVVDVLFRAAEPRDANALAKLIYMADLAHYGVSGYSISLGGTQEHQLDQLQKLTMTQARSWFHWSHFEVAEMEGCAVGAIAGFDKPRGDEVMVEALREIGWNREAVASLEERLADLYSAFPNEPEGFWTIDHVAVMPEIRGRGVARHLLDQVLDRGRELGFRKAKVDVFEGNTAARALYESAGFRLQETFGEEALRRVLGRDALHRLARTL